MFDFQFPHSLWKPCVSGIHLFLLNRLGFLQARELEKDFDNKIAAADAGKCVSALQQLLPDTYFGQASSLLLSILLLLLQA
jgi:hypothetical protein